MSCEDAERALNARLDGRPFDAAALEAHLAGCAACRNAAEDLQEMSSAFARARDAWRPSRNLTPRFGLPWRRWAVAAAMLFLPLAVWAATLVHSEPAEAVAVEAAGADVSNDTQGTYLTLEESP